MVAERTSSSSFCCKFQNILLLAAAGNMSIGQSCSLGTVATAARPVVIHPSSFYLNFILKNIIFWVSSEELIDLNRRMFSYDKSNSLIKTRFAKIIKLWEKNPLL